MKNENITLIDNFLQNDQYQNLKNKIIRNDFPWYYSPNVVRKNEEKQHFQFTHCFFDNQNLFLRDFYYPVGIDDIMKVLNCRDLVRIKANLTTNSNKIIEHSLHRDYIYDCTTSIYYVNSNNGYTLFEDGTKIESIENRMVIFPSNLMHTGTTCTNQNIRCVINFNYF